MGEGRSSTSPLLIPLGVIENVNIKLKSVDVSNQRPFVVKDGLPKIIGKDWLSLLQLWPPTFEQKVCTNISKEKLIDEIKNDFDEVFDTGMGNYKGETIHLSIKPGVKPIFMPVRIVPFTLEDKVNDVIKRLVEAKCIESVEYSESPL